MKTCIVSIGLVILTAVLPAQTGSLKTARSDSSLTPEERSASQAARAQQKLGLDEVQKKQWEEAAMSRSKANAPCRERLKGATTPEERRQLHKEIKKNNEKFVSDIAAFLKPEQKAEFEKEQQLRKERKIKSRHKLHSSN